MYIYIYISCGRTINYTYNKLLRNLGTDGTITRKMVLNIKSMAHLWSNTFFLEDVSITFIDKTDPSNPLKGENYWKTMASWRLKVEDCLK